MTYYKLVSKGQDETNKKILLHFEGINFMLIQKNQRSHIIMDSYMGKALEPHHGGRVL